MPATLEKPKAQVATGSVIAMRDSLLSSLNVIAGVIRARPPKPVLGCVYVSASGRELELRGTNLEQGVRSTLQNVQIESAFAAAVPCDKFAEIIGSMDEETVALELVGTRLRIRGNSSDFHLPTESAGDFPPIPSGEGVPMAEILPGDLRRMIRQTKFAVGTDTRFAFSGVKISANPGECEFVASNDKVLACSTSPVTCPTSFGGIVPPAALALADRAASESDDASFGVSDRMAVFVAGNCTITTNLIEGTFPNWKEFIPADFDKSVEVSLEELHGAIRQGAMIANTDPVDPWIALEFSGEGIVVLAKALGGDSRIAVACPFKGDPIRLGLNPKWIGSGLTAMEGEQVELSLISHARPVLAKCGTRFLCIFMPRQIHD